ncbi:multicopper oxidase family protein [Allorhizocola rhizosphaerae]|uniref:multicopper oxidase family protein n=1 Tax=Allorhizocola rhizosphaerae TaxID=1872709 RepID=UPI001FE3E35B|nr:multicopper oxidase family protein [Allorhizocola rhizosphaerae]
MTAQQLIAADLLLVVLSAAGWLGAGVAAAMRRGTLTRVAAAAAAVLTLARVGVVVALGGYGWWFVQEKVIVALPLVAVAAAALLISRAVGMMVIGVASAAGLLVGYPADVSDALLAVAVVAIASLLARRIVEPATPGAPSPGAPSPGAPSRGGASPVAVSVGIFPAGPASPDTESARGESAATESVGGESAGGESADTASAGGESTGPLKVGSMSLGGPVGGSRFLAGGVALAAVAAFAGVGLAFVPPPELDAGGGPVRTDGVSVPVTQLRGPDAPAPGGTVRRYDLAARQASVTLASGRQVSAWTYNGQVPGPALTATEGDLVEVRLTNVDIPDGVTLHWHGYDVANAEDGAPGVTQDAVLPGQEHLYRFLADQVGTYWYHTHQVSDLGVRLGLYGALIVRPATSAPGLDLTVPVHTLDGTVVIGLDDGVEARQVAPGTPVRLRLINTDSTPHRFTLAGTAFALAAVDGNDLRGPGELRETALSLAAGGRYDLTFTMPSGPVALLVDDDPGVGLRLAPAAEQLTVDTSGWPELDLTTYGTAAEPPLRGPFDRDFTLVLDRGFALVDGVPAYAQTINGRAFPKVPTQHVRLGDLVRLTVVNRSMETHPWHLHGHRVLVLAKDGRAVSGSPLWMDSVDVRPGEVWQLALRADNPGVWMNHCHNLAHADQGMSMHLAYEAVTTPFHGGHGG